jgi:hypothetical protein
VFDPRLNLRCGQSSQFKMIEESTIPGQYIVLFCELSGRFMKSYIFAVQIPASLCGPKFDPDAGGNLLNTLVEALQL